MADFETTDRFKEEYQEYMPPSEEPSATWEAALRARQYLATSNDPTKLPKMYEEGRVPRELGPDTGRARARRTKEHYAGPREFVRHPYVEQVEWAWAASRGESNLQLMVDASPEDLAIMGADPELAKSLERIQVWQAMELEHELDLEKKIETEVETMNRLRGFQRNMSQAFGGTGPAPVSDAERQALAEKESQLSNLNFSDAFNQEFDRWEEDYRHEWQTRLEAVAESKAAMGERHMSPEEIQAELNTRVAQRRTEMFSELAAGQRTGDVFGTDSPFKNNLESVAGGIGWVAGKGAEGLALALNTAGPNKWVYDQLQESSEQRKNELIAEQEAAMARPPEDQFREAAAPLLRGEFDRMAQEGGEEFQTIMKTAGYDINLGFALFAAQVEEDQMEGFMDNLRSADLDALVQLQEADFRVSDRLLEGIAWYGHQVSFLPTALTYFVMDQDKWDNSTTDQWISYLKEIPKKTEELERVPSRAAGIEGSVAGLALDLVGPGILDPIVMLTGPRGSVRTLSPATLAEAANLAKSPIMKHMMRDALDAARSPSRGAGSLLHQIGWMDDVARGEFLAASGWTPQVLPASSWRLTAGAEAAMEVETSFLRRFAPTVTDDVTKLAADLTENGFKEFGEVSISRLTGEIRLTDGAKRLAAAETIENATRMPVTIKLVDNFVDEVSDSRWAALARGETKHAPAGASIPPESLTNRIAAGRKKGWEVKPIGEVDGLIANEMNGIYWLETPSGEFVTGVYAHGKPGTMAGGLAVSSDAAKGQGFFYKLIKIVEETDPDIVLRLAADTSLSDDMYKWAVRYAKDKLAPPTGPAIGTKLDDILGDSETLRPLADYGAGEAIIRPDLLLPRDVLIGGENAADMQRIMAEAAGRGNVPDMASKTVLQRAWNTNFREALRTNAPGRWIERYMGQMPTVRRLELVGPG
ncbi:MAG TPA: hypothetical protein VM537_12990, partial [Anaerolineae bacterium]|nr:hypothetical protein [Anaerolineae bacterium]